MPKAATDVMQSILFAAVVDGISALRTAAKGVPNTMLRDIQSLHRNTTFADLPKELQDSIAVSVRSAFSQLLKEGYSVAPTQTAPARTAERLPNRIPEGQRRGPNDRRGPRPPGRGPRPGPGGKPRG